MVLSKFSCSDNIEKHESSYTTEMKLNQNIVFNIDQGLSSKGIVHTNFK